jgi:hypothetical protein
LLAHNIDDATSEHLELKVRTQNNVIGVRLIYTRLHEFH